jgi:hypothetical protein
MVREAQVESRAVIDQAESDAATRREGILAEADELRREAETEVELRRAEGRKLVDAMRREAERERDVMLAEGERARSEAEAAGEQIRASARDQGRRLVGEAQAVRERMLADLARRRRTAREQLERLNGARERLLAAYEVVKRTVDEATVELTVALPEARMASEAAMRRVAEEPEDTVEVLEAELSVARMTGMVDDVANTVISDEEFDEMLRELGEEADESAEPAAVAPEGEAPPAPAEAPPVADAPLVADAPPVAEVEPEPAVDPASEPVAPVAADGDGADDDVEPSPRVDELFARIRAERPEPASEDEPEPGVGAVALATEDDTAEATGDEDGEEAEAEPVSPEAQALLDRDAALAPIEREMGRRLKRVLADEQNEVLDLLRRGRSVTFADIVPEADEHADRFAIAASGDLDTAADQGAAAVGGLIAETCDELAGQLGRTLVEPLRTRIERSFKDADGDLEEVSERLRALYREWKGQHIGAAVRHYAAAAYAWGAYTAAPDGDGLRWLVDRTGEPCPDADDNALAGEVTKGEPFPTGDRCSPAHPGCRCLVVPATLVKEP